MPVLLAILAIIIIFALWAISVQRKLVVLDENINNAMSQIGLQLSSRFDALMTLLDLTKVYDSDEYKNLVETVQSGRSVITATSTPDDVLRQEGIIFETLDRIAAVTEQHNEIKENPMYMKTMNAIQVYESMIRNSRLIYNDSVTKLNRETRMFPVSILARLFGFTERNYLAEHTSR